MGRLMEEVHDRREVYPTIRQQREINRMRTRVQRAPAIAEAVGLPVELVLHVMAWQKRIWTSGHEEFWFQERLLLPGYPAMVCPRCRARLRIYIPGQPCRACLLRDFLAEQRSTPMDADADEEK